jgi:thioesterase domain-containing protein
VLFQKGTIANLAMLIDRGERSEDIASVVPLGTNGSGRPLFILPTIGGEVIFSPALIEQLRRVVPVAALQPTLEPRHLEQFRDFQTTAGHFASALRAFQPRGPYALMGFSYGGLLAFEVALMLTQAGETVDLLAVVDTGPNHRGRTLGARDHWQRWVRVTRNLPSWVREDVAHGSARRLIASTARAWRMFYRTKLLRSPVRLDDMFDVNRIASQNRDLMRTVFAAVSGYVPRGRYAGTLTLFRATTDPLLRGFAPDLGWRRFVDRLDLRYLDGNHESILHPQRVGELARQLSELLSRRAPDGTDRREPG